MSNQNNESRILTHEERVHIINRMCNAAAWASLSPFHGEPGFADMQELFSDKIYIKLGDLEDKFSTEEEFDQVRDTLVDLIDAKAKALLKPNPAADYFINDAADGALLDIEIERLYQESKNKESINE